MNRYAPIAASLILVAVLITTLLPTATQPSYAGENIVMAPEGGRLDALDNEGNVLGPCALKHTDVDVSISGHFTRVTLKQQYHNPYSHKIEAVYTFPLSHRAAVDRMKMTIGDRVVIGEVHERVKARAIYEAAREQGYVASLLEQERPNIFTQSLANIEQNAEIEIEISYVELLASKDGTYSFDFPMVVGPRYIPCSPRTPSGDLPVGLDARQGLILLEPATLALQDAGDVTARGTLQTGKLEALVHAAVPIKGPSAEAQPALWYRFEAKYCSGAKELGTLHTDGTGQLNGRWFYADPQANKNQGTGFSPDAAQVPDASRITPEPVKPGKRAGHDISIKVSIDTGGPGIIDLKSALHEIMQTRLASHDNESRSRVTIELEKRAEIPNRDFVLTWRQTSDKIEEATFTHTGKHGNFLTLILQPPARVKDAEAVARELIFVLDTSGSMSGFPIDKAKEVMAKAIDALRPQDTFNLITFSGDTHILWAQPKPGSKMNIAEAQRFLAGRQGGGGTEMMKAINAALVQTVNEAPVSPIRIVCFMTDGYVGNDMAIIDAIKQNAATTRVFSFGIGNSVNRYLLDGMARAGRGEAEYVLLNENADEKVQRFAQRIQTPVLTDIQVEFSDGLQVSEMMPQQIPDLFDVKPLVLHGRYTSPGKGTVTIRGKTGFGRYERTLPVDLPAAQPAHDTIATLWARTKVEELMNRDLSAAQQGNFPQEFKNEVVRLGETFGIMTQFTSFVAVEKARVTIGGQPQLVAIPIEMPQGVSYEGVFGMEARVNWSAKITAGLTDAAPAPGRLIGMGAGHPQWSYERGRSYGFESKSYFAQSGPPAQAPMSLGKSATLPQSLERLGLDSSVPIERDDRGITLNEMQNGQAPPTGAANMVHDLTRSQRTTGSNGVGSSPGGKSKISYTLELGENNKQPGESNTKGIANLVIDELRQDMVPTTQPVLTTQPARLADEREAKLRHRLDERLFSLAISSTQPASADETIRVTVLLSAVNAETLAALKKSGLKIEATAESLKIVVGSISGKQLAELALLDGVRRIEPTVFND